MYKFRVFISALRGAAYARLLKRLSKQRDPENARVFLRVLHRLAELSATLADRTAARPSQPSRASCEDITVRLDLRLEDELDGVELDLRRGGLHRLLARVVRLLAERHGGRDVG